MRLLLSAVWASGRSCGRVRGPGGGIERLGSGFPLLVPVQGPAGALVQCRLRREFSSGLAGGAGIPVRTYFCLQDCVVSQTTTGRAQYSAGKRSPRTESTSWTRTAVTNASAQRPELLSPHRTVSTPLAARAPLRSATARGWGCTGQGLSVLHETPTPVEYTRMPASSAPPSCSGDCVRGGKSCMAGPPLKRDAEA